MSGARVETGHVGLNVSDIERSRRFYEEAFGLRTTHESTEPGRRYLFLGDGERLVLTLWQQSEGGFERARPGLHHLSFQVASIDEVTSAHERLRRLGARFHHDGIVAHAEGAGSAGIFFEDPDGIRLEIYSPTAAGAYPAADGPACGFF